MSEIIELDITEKEKVDFVTTYIKSHLSKESHEQFCNVLSETNDLGKACEAGILNQFIVDAINNHII